MIFFSRQIHKAIIPLFITCIFSFFLFFCHGQNISGIVTDQNNNPLEFATISLKKDSTELKSTISGPKGNYEFDLVQPGTNYRIVCSIVGHTTVDTSFIFISGTQINIALQAASNSLKTVTVTSRKPLIERKIDRLVFNVENNVNTIGSDALEVLGITPMVRVVNEGISIVGKSGVSIMVNDKLLYLSGESLKAYLKSIPAETIMKIEVITNPSAKYDAQGGSGLINIVIKKTKKLGYNGIITTNFFKNTYQGINTVVNMNYNTNKIQFFAGLSLAKGAGGPVNGLQIFYNSQTWDQTYKKKEYSSFINGNVGFEMPLSKNTNFGVSYNGSHSNPDALTNSTTTVYNSGSKIDSVLRANTDADILYSTNSVNIHFDHNIDSLGKKISIDADWFQNKSGNDNNINNSNYFESGLMTPGSHSEYLSNNNQQAQIYTANVLLDLPIKTATFSLGGKLTFIDNKSDVSLYQKINDEYIVDVNNTNSFHFIENTQALFVNYDNSFKKWEVQFGLRAEYTQTKGISPTLSQVNKNDYFNIFPTAYLNYKPNDKNTFGFSYGRRINRPSFSLLNPYRTYLDRYYYLTGNPGLNPSFPHNFELSHTYKDFLTTTLTYSYSKNEISAITLLENGSNTQVFTFGNYFTSVNYGLNTSLSLSNKWLESECQFSVYYSHTHSSNPATLETVQGFGEDFSTVNNIFFNKARTFTGGINFTYEFPNTSGISKQKTYYWLDISAKYQAMKKKLQLGLSLRDVFKTKDYTSEEFINDVRTIRKSNNDSRRLILSIRYSFGNSKIKKGRSHSNNGEEQGRAN